MLPRLLEQPKRPVRYYRTSKGHTPWQLSWDIGLRKGDGRFLCSLSSHSATNAFNHVSL